jgi:phosphoglycerol transferase
MRKITIFGMLRVAALLLLVAVVWCVVRNRISVESWRVPTEYTGDADQILSWFKAASEWDYVPFWNETVTRLGAPYHANWNDFPMYEKFLIFFLGMVAKCIGLGAAGNFGELLGHLTSALSFYLCCRFLKHSKTWSFVGAALFSLTYYHFFRNLSHVLLAFSYTLPWAILSGWIIADSQRLERGNRLYWICLVTALVMGVSNPYNLNMYVQLLGFALLVQLARARRRENLLAGLTCIAAAGFAFIAINFGTLAFQWTHGKNQMALQRHYLESELYALKPMEFFIPPPTHNLRFLADIGSNYISGAFVKGEAFSPYLGIIGMAGLLWIFAEAFLLIVRNVKRTRSVPPYAFQTTWIIFYAIVGGVNCLIFLLGVHYFRATDRYSIFISTIILMFLVARLSVWSRRWTPGANLALAAVVLVIGIFDQTPRPTTDAEIIRGEKVIASDEAFGRELNQKLPAYGMVFELPVRVFPDPPTINNFSGYELLRPYYVTKTLRFSYGSIVGRNREDWQWEVEKMPGPQMVSALEQYGFCAIYFNRRAFADHGDDLLKQLATANRTDIFEDESHEQVVVRLNPSPTPELPHTDDRAQIYYKSGWAITELTPLETQVWAGGDAALTFFSEPKEVTAYTFKCAIGSISARRVTISMNGRELWSGDVPAGQAVALSFNVDGTHGNNKIEFVTDQPAVQPNKDAPPLTFTLLNLEITKVSPGR